MGLKDNKSKAFRGLQKWNDLKIGAKVGIGFGLVILLSAIIGGIAIINMSKIQVETKYLANESLPSVNESFRTDKNWREIITTLQAYDVSRDSYYLDRATQYIGKFSHSLDALISLADASNKSTVSKDKLTSIKASLAEFSQLLSTYKEVMVENQKALVNFENSLKDLQNSGVINSLNGAGYHIFLAINKGQPRELENADKYIRDARNSASTATSQLAVESAQKVVVGLKKAGVLELKRNEIEGLLKVDISALADVGLDQITEMTETTNSIISESRVSLTIIMLIILVFGVVVGWIIASSITTSIKEGLKLAQNISNGILHRQREVSRKDEIGELMTALNRMNNQLKFIVEDISQGIKNISVASQKMNRNAAELSETATDQAATTEEISSSIEELHANFLQNAENATTTEAIAMAAVEGIRDGNRATELASKSLNSIIERVGFIGDLAFQTNILALNAAVEAARAGEHGRGFAVVAAEVKKLADSSKEAAQLINKVSRETVIASDQAGLKLQKIVPEIEKTANLIQGIKLASNEQEVGINQINNAIQQLNNIAQQNAFSSENMAVSSQDLSTLAEKLQKTISFFQIGAGTN
jgi:methyl-accepting chemotaxis protein